MVSSKFDAETQDKLQGLIKTLNKIERRQNSFAGRELTQKIIYVHNYKDMSAYKSLMLTVSEVGVCYDIPLNKTREACLDYDWKPRNQIIQGIFSLFFFPYLYSFYLYTIQYSPFFLSLLNY